MLFLFLANISDGKGQLLTDSLIASYSLADIDSIYTANALPPFVGAINYPVDVYKVTYETPDPQGNMTYTSGAVFIPGNDTCSAPIISYQHGTISNRESVPSRMSGEALIGVVAATGGYVVSMTDYLGLGDGPGFHPYIHAKSEATAVIDMIRTTKQLCTNEGVLVNTQLFLMGYSQGGHATMATLREIELYHASEFDVIAAIPMAGPYDVSGVQRAVLESDSVYSQPGYLPYITTAYNSIYNIYDSIEEVFTPPYDSLIPALFDGTNSMGTINGFMPGVPKLIVDTAYFNAYDADSLHPFKMAMRDNDVYDWIPQSYLRIVHCNGDQVIPFANAQVAYDAFIAMGADSVELIDAGSADHVPCAQSAIIGAKLYIDTRAEFCSFVFGEEELSGSRLKIEAFPNPFNDVTTIKICGESREMYELQIIDLTGKMVLVKNVMAGSQVNISKAELSAGCYIANLLGEESTGIKLLVQ